MIFGTPVLHPQTKHLFYLLVGWYYHTYCLQTKGDASSASLRGGEGAVVAVRRQMLVDQRNHAYVHNGLFFYSFM